jgi:hypothetical protein
MKRVVWLGIFVCCGTVSWHVSRHQPLRDSAGGTPRPLRMGPAPARTRIRSGAPIAEAAPALRGFADRPLAFERNEGQTGESVKFLARGSGYALFLTADGAMWVSAETPERGGYNRARFDAPNIPGPAGARAGVKTPTQLHSLRMHLAGANRNTLVRGLEEQPSRVHYYLGDDPAAWRTDVPTFARVRYDAVYPGIDLVYYGRQGQLEYDFLVAPGANPADIKLRFEGATRLAVGRSGDLILETPAGPVTQRKPAVYQDFGGIRHEVQGTYVLESPTEVGFSVAPYDRSRPLVIDPVLSYSTYIGGTGGTWGELAYGIASDPLENVYLTGWSNSAVLPSGGTQAAQTDGAAFVMKLSPAGTLLYTIVIGGSGDDSGEGVAVDSSGQVVITGFTFSSNYPVLNPFRLDKGGQDGFLTAFDAAGHLRYSTYLTGSGSTDAGEWVALDASGNAYVTGVTNSVDLPVLNAYQPTKNVDTDAFVMKVSPTGALLYSTYLGGGAEDEAEGIDVDTLGNFYIAGMTGSVNFPTTSNRYQTFQALGDAFVAKFQPSGALEYSTYIGGRGRERAFNIVVDPALNIYISGYTESCDFPAVHQIQNFQHNCTFYDKDAFVARLRPAPAGYDLDFSTFLGGNGGELPQGLDLRDNHLYLTGWTDSTNFPIVNAVQATKAGLKDAFVVDIDLSALGNVPATAPSLAFSTYLGGTGDEEGRSVVALAGRNIFVTGGTRSTNFPTVRAIQDVNSAPTQNIYLACISPLGVSSVSPQIAPLAGGDVITLNGQGFANGAVVEIGGAAATSAIVVSATTISAVTPAHVAGTVDVVVRNPDGGTGTLYGGFVFVGQAAGPTVTTPGDQTNAEGDSVTLPISATDPGGATLTYSASGLPAGLDVDAATGVISGTIASNAQTSDVTVSASNGTSTGSATFRWTLTRTNRAPVVTNPGNQTTAEDAGVTLAIAASDPDGDSLSYSATGLPAGLAIKSTTGVISGTVAL